MKIMERIKKELKDSLYKEYGTKLLSTKQVAKVVNKSEVTLRRWKKQGVNLSYKQGSYAKNAPIFYTLETVVDYIVNNNIKVV